MKRSSDTRKAGRIRLLCRDRILLAAALLLALLPRAGFAAWCARDYIRESSASSYETVDIPIDGFELNGAALDRYFRNAYPDDCAGMDLTCVRLNIHVESGAITGGSMSMEYFRYIDESREGGKVASVEFHMDPLTGRLLEVSRFCGPGKGCAVYMEPVSPQIVDFPLVWYVEHLPELTSKASDRPLRLYCTSACWGLLVKAFDKAAETEPLVYSELTTDWSEATGFPGRTWKPEG